MKKGTKNNGNILGKLIVLLSIISNVSTKNKPELKQNDSDLFNTCFAGRILIVNKISLFNGILYHLFKNLINGRYARFYKGVNFTYELILNINHVSLKIYKILCRLLNYN